MEYEVEAQEALKLLEMVMVQVKVWYPQTCLFDDTWTHSVLLIMVHNSSQ